MHRQFLVGSAIIAMIASPAFAEVKSDTTAGFETYSATIIAADPATVWAALIKPATWWNGAHSWSGEASNMSLDPRAGGCFCETLTGGNVEHARVVMAQAPKVLRLSGALGPLQSEAVTGTLSWELKPEGAGTMVSVSYVVAGYIRSGRAALPGGVDAVIAEQLAGLKRRTEAR